MAKISFVLLFRWEGEYLLNPLLSNPLKKHLTWYTPEIWYTNSKNVQNCWLGTWASGFKLCRNHFWYLDVEPKIGGFYPPKWMVIISWFQTLLKWDDLVGFPTIFGGSWRTWHRFNRLNAFSSSRISASARRYGGPLHSLNSLHSLKLTACPWKMNGWNTIVSFWEGLFSGAKS